MSHVSHALKIQILLLSRQPRRARFNPWMETTTSSSSFARPRSFASGICQLQELHSKWIIKMTNPFLLILTNVVVSTTRVLTRS